jgi:NIPSNAP
MKILLITFLAFLSLPSFSQKKTDTREFYEFRIYHFTSQEQGGQINTYLEKALLPALHRQGIKNIGVFTALANDTAAVKDIYVLTPYPNLNAKLKSDNQLLSDKVYLEAGKEYIDASYDKAPFSRFETILMQAFRDAPVLQKPALSGARDKRVYELRSYESATEKIYRNKVEMFNEGGEVALFKRLGFNAIFYADVIIGPRMPNLMYITSFEDQASRDAHWKTFVDDPEWKKLSSMPQYQKNVSKADIIFLRPTAYSDY